MRGEVYLMNLDPVMGNEVGKPRPCVVISPDDLNRRAGTFIIAPLSSQHRRYPSRVDCQFRGRQGQAQLDQIRALSPLRIVSKLGRLEEDQLNLILDRLAEMFAP
ncbi:MAG TPA: type II toxin-antitoxin system PemK/MazF family toxin [Candidatus Saccharimonadia bacterium]|nr:type II toxin-antitoxin system PemK/MazF family toxin [Candidatus Saccharimonadia bacterium]